MPERLAYFMAVTSKYCADNDFQYLFWTFAASGEIALKVGAQYKIVDLRKAGGDPRIYEMLADPKIHAVMKGDVLRFTIDYLWGGFYADADTVLMNIQDLFLKLDYVCGYERARNGAGRPGCENRPICTGFFGAPERSTVNFLMSQHILNGYDEIKRTGKYPADMWDVIALTVDPLVKICDECGVKPFPMEYFFPYPIPEIDAPFSIHHYAGTEPGGWTFDLCSNDDCKKCSELATCKISRHGRR